MFHPALLFTQKVMTLLQNVTLVPKMLNSQIIITLVSGSSRLHGEPGWRGNTKVNKI